MFKTIFVIAVFVVGLVDWLKKLLPTSVTENKKIMAVISGVISVTGGALYVLLGEKLGLATDLDSTYWANYAIYSVGTWGTVQTSYTILFKTFKTVEEKLKGKYTNNSVDSEELSEEIVSTIDEKIAEAVTGVLDKKSAKKK